MEIINITLDKLTFAEDNSKIHTDKQIDMIAESIKQYGFVVPVLISETYEIIGGHGRVLASKKLGMTEVPCIKITHLSPEQIKAYRIVDNSVVAEWDFDKLTEEMSGLFNFTPEKFGFDFKLENGIEDRGVTAQSYSSEPKKGSRSSSSQETSTKTEYYQYCCPGCGHKFNKTQNSANEQDNTDKDLEMLLQEVL